MGLFSFGMIPQLQQSLNASSMNQKVISENIANVDTPNYNAKQVSFSDALNQSLSAIRTDPRHLPFTSDDTIKIVNDNSGIMQNNGNNVDIDKEMTDLAKNQINYQTLVELINSRFSDMQTVVKEGS